MAMPDVLYQYTSPSGFTKILETSQLWATDTRFLNDAQELRYAWEVFWSTLTERAAQGSEYSDAYTAQLEAMRSMKAENLDELEIRIFSASLTELQDDVPQWRSYAADGHGVALGFASESVIMLKAPIYNHTGDGQLTPLTAINTKEAVTWGAVLGQVRYGAEARKAAIDQEIWQIEQICGKNDQGTFDQKVYNCIHRVPEHLNQLALVKHEGFQSEQEWRLTIHEHSFSSAPAQIKALSKLTDGVPPIAYDGMPLSTVDVQFREGGPGLFKPYTKLPFEKSALVKVVLGPNVNAELAVPVVRRMLDRQGFRHTEIVPSGVPYRS